MAAANDADQASWHAGVRDLVKHSIASSSCGAPVNRLSFRQGGSMS